MGPVLSDNLFFMFGEEDPIQVEKACMWVVEGEIIRPSTSLTLWNKLKPGVYRVDVSKDYGLYCQRIRITSDELFKFSDSKIPEILNEVNKFWDKAEQFKNEKLVHKRGILLFGKAGCGKTSLISLLCDSVIERKGVVFVVSDRTNLNYYLSFIKGNLREIEPNTPIITIIEDIDKYEEDDLILDFLDGKTQIEHHVIIATSNNTTRIPSTMLRPSRIDLKVEINLPNEKIRGEYFEHKNVSPDLIPNLVEKTKGFSIAELKELYISMFLLDYSLEESIEKIKTPQKRKDYTLDDNKNKIMGL